LTKLFKKVAPTKFHGFPFSKKKTVEEKFMADITKALQDFKAFAPTVMAELQLKLGSGKWRNAKSALNSCIGYLGTKKRILVECKGLPSPH
jgi:hypothetical protein